MSFTKLVEYITALVIVNIILLFLVSVESFLFAQGGFYALLPATFIFSVAIFYGLGYFKNPKGKSDSKVNTEFILMVVHKLRTSLTGVKWPLRMLLSGDFGQTTLEQKDIIKKIGQRTNTMISSVNDLLDLARAEDGNHVYNMSLYSVEDIVQSVINDYQSEIASKNIKFSFDRPENVFAKTMLDKEAIEAVIQNLLDNAIKYTPSGGMIKVSLQTSGKEIEIQVQDSGMGIPKQKQQHIFDKFFRSDNAIKNDPSGAGLGLFIAKNIISAHNGKIWFQSQENKGSTFYVTLPIAFPKNI